MARNAVAQFHSHLGTRAAQRAADNAAAAIADPVAALLAPALGGPGSD